MYNNIERKIYNFIKKNGLIESKEHVIVGISGGADSTCLLYVLKRMADRLSIKLTAIHINHMIRGDEALRDENHVIEFCNRLDIDVIVERIDVIKLAKDRKMSCEEAGRFARYNTFYRYQKELGADKIAVAHNKNDSVETVLMNMIRGSGLDGLKGIDAKRGVIVRPILVLTRDEIECYCREEGLDYVVDSTNKETIYTRNKVRLKLIKDIDDMFGVDIVSKVDRMSQLVKSDNDFLEEMANEALSDCMVSFEEEDVSLRLDRLKLLHDSIQRRVLKRAVVMVNKVINRIECKHIEDMLKLVHVNKTGLWLSLPNGIKAYKDYGILRIYKEKEKECVVDKEILIDILYGSKDIQVDDKRMLKVEVLDVVDRGESLDAYTRYFDYNILLGQDLKIRKRRNGDRFKPFNSGTKKLKKYFIDRKISKPERDSMYLLAKGSDIIWIIGDKVSDKFKITEKSKKIVRFSLASMI